MKNFVRTPIAWLIAGLLVLVAVNLVSDAAFLKITLQDGHLYGVPIDILNQGSRTMLLALFLVLLDPNLFGFFYLRSLLFFSSLVFDLPFFSYSMLFWGG